MKKLIWIPLLAGCSGAFAQTVSGSGHLSAGSTSQQTSPVNEAAKAQSLAINPVANGVDVITSTRFTDTSPTGNFMNLKSLAGASLFKIDIAGNLMVPGAATFTKTAYPGNVSLPIQFQGSGFSPGIAYINTDSPGVAGEAFNLYWGQYNASSALKQIIQANCGLADVTAGAEQAVCDWLFLTNGSSRRISMGGIVSGGNHIYLAPGDNLGYNELGLKNQGWSRIRMDNVFDVLTPPSIEIDDHNFGVTAGGLWRVRVGSGRFKIERNTAKAGDFSTTNASCTIGSNDVLQCTVGGIFSGPFFFGRSGNILLNPGAPSIPDNGCGGSGASILLSNGTAAFTVNVGSRPGSTCTIKMPTAANDWICSAVDVTSNSTSVFLQKLTATSAGSITITNYNHAATATAFVTSDKLKVMCLAE